MLECNLEKTCTRIFFKDFQIARVRVLFEVFENPQVRGFFKIAREIMLLLINNIHITKLCRTKSRLRNVQNNVIHSIVKIIINNHLSERQKLKQRVLMFYKVKITKNRSVFHFPALYYIFSALYYITIALYSTNQNAVILSCISLLSKNRVKQFLPMVAKNRDIFAWYLLLIILINKHNPFKPWFII